MPLRSLAPERRIDQRELDAEWLTSSSTPNEIMGFVLACEVDNHQSVDGATNLAWIIANRMKSGTWAASSAVDVVKMSGEFDCYSAGAAPGNPAFNQPAPSNIQSIADYLVQYGAVERYTVDPTVAHVGLNY